MASFLFTMWQPLVDALFAPRPLQHRWRLLLLLPISILTCTGKGLPYLFSRPFVEIHIPTRRPEEKVRALVYNHPSRCSKLKNGKKRPLHIDIHGGGFIGGLPESDTPFCTQAAETSGAVVISVTYRFAPRYPFPAAHDDVEDALLWLLSNAEKEFGADTELITVSGFSAGGNLALAAALGAKNSEGENIVKGAVTFYAPVDLRIPPQDKRKPPGFPSFDPFWLLFPLFNAYAGLGGTRNIENSRLHPIIAPLEDWPADTLFVIPAIDFLLYEQLDLIERLQREAAEANKKKITNRSKKSIEKLIFEGQWHGWLELPSWAIDEATRRKAFKSACDFIVNVHRKNGFQKD